MPNEIGMHRVACSVDDVDAALRVAEDLQRTRDRQGGAVTAAR